MSLRTSESEGHTARPFGAPLHLQQQLRATPPGACPAHSWPPSLPSPTDSAHSRGSWPAPGMLSPDSRAPCPPQNLLGLNESWPHAHKRPSTPTELLHGDWAGLKSHSFIITFSDLPFPRRGSKVNPLRHPNARLTLGDSPQTGLMTCAQGASLVLPH